MGKPAERSHTYIYRLFFTYSQSISVINRSIWGQNWYCKQKIKVHQLYGVFPAIIAVMTAFCSREILDHAILCLFLFEIQISFLF